MMEIRAATEGEAPAVASVIRRSFRRQAQLLGLDRSECPDYVAFETAARVRRRMRLGCEVALASISEEAVGTVSFRYEGGHPAAGEIMRLAVLPSHRGNGHGSRMMAHAEQCLGSAGAAVARISIVAEFTRLRVYYEQLGYRAIVRRRVSGLRFELLYMEKTLTSS